MYHTTYCFQTNYDGPLHLNENIIFVDSSNLFTKEDSYGFVTEDNRNQYEYLQILDINAGIEPWYWLTSQSLTHITDSAAGCMIAPTSKNERIPLIFKAYVPHSGNYNVTITITTEKEPIKDLMIFTGRRRLMTLNETIQPNTTYERTFTVNVCDIIPRGKEIPYSDNSINISIFADRPTISCLRIEEVNVPTIYIAGDSTVTDQTGNYPYRPEYCYSGWGQILPSYLKSGIAVSNHAHSGLTTESFIKEGHYQIVKDHIQKGDYFFLQFGHNDQKLPELSAKGGYTNYINRYIDEMEEIGATPVIVTPLARNTWKPDASYNDLLEEFANSCIEIGKKRNVKVLDLHKKSMDFVIDKGIEKAKLYYHPNDYTHSNDFGAYLFAGFVVDEIMRLHCEELIPYLHNNDGEFLPPDSIEDLHPPKDYKQTNFETHEVKFTDISSCKHKNIIYELTAKGVINNETDTFRPEDKITRVELLDFCIRAIHLVPMNVYNDMYEDVMGHEWFAGIVETSYLNGLVPKEMIDGKNFLPNSNITMEMLLCICINAYQSRHTTKESNSSFLLPNVSFWANKSIGLAKELGLLPEHFDASHLVTREEAIVCIKKLIDLVEN